MILQFYLIIVINVSFLYKQKKSFMKCQLKKTEWCCDKQCISLLISHNSLLICRLALVCDNNWGKKKKGSDLYSDFNQHYKKICMNRIKQFFTSLSSCWNPGMARQHKTILIDPFWHTSFSNDRLICFIYISCQVQVLL